VYGILYHEGVAEELGGPDQFRQLLSAVSAGR
jgi:hypothetical protein